MKAGKTRVTTMLARRGLHLPQWSPAMKAGKTRILDPAGAAGRTASMEPGHEGREDLGMWQRPPEARAASMEPGHEGREDTVPDPQALTPKRPQWSPAMKAGKT